jgi:predicted transcriptional regulator
MDRMAELRRSIAELGPRRRGARIPEDLRREIATYARERRDDGVTLDAVADEIGVSAETIRRYVQRKRSSRELVRVEVIPDAMEVDALVVISPRGYRVEGLDLERAARLLRLLD